MSTYLAYRELFREKLYTDLIIDDGIRLRVPVGVINLEVWYPGTIYEWLKDMGFGDVKGWRYE